MGKRSDEQFLVIQDTIEANRKETVEKKMNTDEKLTQITEDLKVLTETIKSMMDQTKKSKLSPAQKYTSTPTDPTTVVLANRRAPTLYMGHPNKIGGMWTLKHEIRSPKFYELLIKKEIKGNTDLYLKNF